MQDEKQDVKIEIYKIGFLVSIIHTLDIENVVIKELLEVYYSGLEQGKLNGFTDTEIIINDKPNLINFLLNQETVEFNIDINKNKINKKALNF